MLASFRRAVLGGTLGANPIGTHLSQGSLCSWHHGRRWFGRETGVVVKWDGERGFGKVKRDDGTEFFVHSSYLQQTPMSEGQAVTFEVRWNDKHKQHHAIDVGLRQSPASTPAVQLPDFGSVGNLPQPELLQVEPMSLPPDASDRQHLEMLVSQTEQLRKQGHQSQQLLVQNQQLLVQGLFALIQQQSIQNANLERALRALTDRMGAREPAQAGGSKQQAELQDTLPGAQPRVDTQVAQDGPDEEAKADAVDDEMPPVKEATEVPETQPLPEVVEPVEAQASEKAEEAVGKQEPEAAASGGDVAERPEDDAPKESEPAKPPSNEAEAPKSTSISPPPFYIAGSFNDWSADSELMDGGSAVVTIRSSAPMGSRKGMQKEEFQILEDGSWDQRLFPAGGSSEAVVVLKPGRFSQAERSSAENPGHGRNWAVEGKPGASFRILYQPSNGRVACEHA
ncbi:glh-2 [Symbiodinium natans]|uniref:Glh-2 protein n=1 Tax=Symbiodinium natans TaxID=878477 RepID=A0A812RH21_9DINO|nr:glh-2 [Symbiodinium natans]